MGGLMMSPQCYIVQKLIDRPGGQYGAELKQKRHSIGRGSMLRIERCEKVRRKDHLVRLALGDLPRSMLWRRRSQESAAQARRCNAYKPRVTSGSTPARMHCELTEKYPKEIDDSISTDTRRYGDEHK
jgi:hypothetical protein